MPALYRRILVCRTDHLGDVLLATPVASALKLSFPGVSVSFLVHPSCGEVPRHHPDIDETLETAPGQSAAVLAQRLREKAFDAVVLVYPDPRVSWACFRAGIPVRVGTRNRLWSVLYTHRAGFHRSRGEHRHEMEYDLELLKSLPDYMPSPAVVRLEPVFRTTPAEAEFARAWLRERRLLGKRLIAVHPGSFGSALNWGPDRYAETADALARRYRAVVVLTGTAPERILAETVKGKMKFKAYNAAGETDLVTLAGVYRHCLLFLGSSTGTLHLASAVGTPSIGIFCPLSVCGPWRWAPRGRHARAILSIPFRDCPDCPKARCPYYNCMDHIAPDQVLAAAQQLVKGLR